MGCHTWFYKPATKKELAVIRKLAYEEANELYGLTPNNVENNLTDMALLDKLLVSINKDSSLWKDYRLGESGHDDKGNEISECYTVRDGQVFIDLSFNYNPLFRDLCRFHDVFRVKNYSRREIHSMRELRRFLRKRYFELTEDQHRKCMEFFRLYPGGFICFG